jgi:hypothetical protein
MQNQRNKITIHKAKHSSIKLNNILDVDIYYTNPHRYCNNPNYIDTFTRLQPYQRLLRSPNQRKQSLPTDSHSFTFPLTNTEETHCTDAVGTPPQSVLPATTLPQNIPQSSPHFH